MSLLIVIYTQSFSLHRLFLEKCQEEDTKAQNFQLQENFYILQNLVTMDLLQIPKKFQIPGILTLCANDFHKINKVKSPSKKLEIIQTVVNNLSNAYEN